MHIDKAAIVNESPIKSTQARDSLITYDSHIFKDNVENIFSADYWRSKDAILGQALGRGVTWFFRTEEKECVLRHYYRGGMVGKVLNDHYLCYRYSQSRAYKEFYLLKNLIAKSLPVPKPLAFRVIRSGIFCMNDIITERIRDADSLGKILLDRPVDDAIWTTIGKTIRQFHDQFVYHHDLNVHNIMLDKKDKIWLIDFDQGEIRPHSVDWKTQNMSRLYRSFLKEKSKASKFFWEESNWEKLSESYRSP